MLRSNIDSFKGIGILLGVIGAVVMLLYVNELETASTGAIILFVGIAFFFHEEIEKIFR